jgi:dTMP kinase
VPTTDAIFVAFEGGEGSGKSTQVGLLAAALREAGRTVVVTHEPGATEVGQQIRQLLLHHRSPLTPRAEALLFAADRAQHVETVIRPALAAGKVVITDRYVDSSLAYQGSGRQLSVEEIAQLSRWATDGLRPDLTVVLDLPADEGLRRARGRGEFDKVENESLQFHERVRSAFRTLAAADPSRYLVLDARQSPQQLAERIRAAVLARPAEHVIGEPA